MDNQQQNGQSVTKDWTHHQMPETARELLLQAKAAEQRLEQNQTGEGSQALVFESNLGNAMGLAMNAGFATLHPNGLRGFYCLVWCLQFYQLRDRFFIAGSHLIAWIIGIFWSSLSVNSSRRGILSR
jgi:hypothetical protein